ncbi:hypothetical protein MC885_003298 [Smutsia gigantea]|nr:hypothetical protein MC885_003298 [Smutsia gigantea]
MARRVTLTWHSRLPPTLLKPRHCAQGRRNKSIHQNRPRGQLQRASKSHRQKDFPVGLHDAYNAQDRQAEEADAHKHANPGGPVDVIVVRGFQQGIEAVLVGHEEDALGRQGDAAHLEAEEAFFGQLWGLCSRLRAHGREVGQLKRQRPVSSDCTQDGTSRVPGGLLLTILFSRVGMQAGVGDLHGHEAQISASGKQRILGLINVCSTLLAPPPKTAAQPPRVQLASLQSGVRFTHLPSLPPRPGAALARWAGCSGPRRFSTLPQFFEPLGPGNARHVQTGSLDHTKPSPLVHCHIVKGQNDSCEKYHRKPMRRAEVAGVVWYKMFFDQPDLMLCGQ